MIDILSTDVEKTEAHEYGGESGVTRTLLHGDVSHADMLGFMRTEHPGRHIHSDGFLSLGGMVEPMYVCECGFHGLILDVVCARCGQELGGVRSIQGRQGTTTATEGAATEVAIAFKWYEALGV